MIYIFGSNYVPTSLQIPITTESNQINKMTLMIGIIIHSHNIKLVHTSSILYQEWKTKKSMIPVCNNYYYPIVLARLNLAKNDINS
jgi:hypothetical protein